jgi:polyhydroxyalkanoate synthesis regulator phasin
MPQTPDLSKYLDAGAQFVALTRAEARRRARELVEAGQLAQGQVQSFVDDLVEESRRRADEMTDVVRKEIQRQVKTLGIATKDDLARLEAKLAKQTAKATKKSGTKSSAEKSAKSGAKKSGTKKTGTKAAKKSSAPRAAAS